MGIHSRCALGGALALAALSLGGGPAPAAERRPPVLGLFRDMRLGVHARRALNADGDLKKLNLAVRVDGGEATIWGPIPSAELERRAVALLEEVRGIRRVRSELYVVSGAGQPKQSLLDLLPPPTVVQVASPDRDRGELRRDLLTPAETTSGRREQTSIGPSLPRLDGPRPVRRPAQSERRAEARPAGRSLVEAIEDLRRGQRRFDGIRFAVQGAVVRLWADDVPEEDVEAFTRAVRAVPGVRDVKPGG
jgi:hypothetical protein